MATRAQKKANRKNARKATGPKTKKGKEISSQNAIKHGLTATQTVIGTENQQEFELLRREMIDDLNPIGPVQYRLADRIASLSWRLKRAEGINNQTIEIMLEEDALKYPDPDKYDPDRALGRIAINDFSNEKIIERIARYERRIENSLYKTMKQLKILKNEPNSKHSTHDSRATAHESQKMQNEPNFKKTNLTPAITKDYEHALLHGYPEDKPYPPQKTINHSQSSTQRHSESLKRPQTMQH
jgi:hypothetical protein